MHERWGWIASRWFNWKGSSCGIWQSGYWMGEVLNVSLLRLISLSLCLIRGKMINIHGNRIFVQFKYEWLPRFCFGCGMISHSTMGCSWRHDTGSEGSTSSLQFGGKLRAPSSFQHTGLSRFVPVLPQGSASFSDEGKMALSEDQSGNVNCSDQLLGDAEMSLQGLAGKVVTATCHYINWTIPQEGITAIVDLYSPTAAQSPEGPGSSSSSDPFSSLSPCNSLVKWKRQIRGGRKKYVSNSLGQVDGRKRKTYPRSSDSPSDFPFKLIGQPDQIVKILMYRRRLWHSPAGRN